MRIFSSDASKIDSSPLFPISFSFIMSSIMTYLASAFEPQLTDEKEVKLHPCIPVQLIQTFIVACSDQRFSAGYTAKASVTADAAASFI